MPVSQRLYYLFSDGLHSYVAPIRSGQWKVKTGQAFFGKSKEKKKKRQLIMTRFLRGKKEHGALPIMPYFLIKKSKLPGMLS